MQFIEPAWKMLLSNKGLLPVLWELFPGHPNLLPAYDAPEPLGGRYIRKPKLSREGSNVAWIEGGVVVEENEGNYGEEGFVYQAPATCRTLAAIIPSLASGWWITKRPAWASGKIPGGSRATSAGLCRTISHELCEPHTSCARHGRHVRGQGYRMVGRSVMGETESGETYYWNEYHLETTAGENATLVFDESESDVAWRMFAQFGPEYPITAAEAATKFPGTP